MRKPYFFRGAASPFPACGAVVVQEVEKALCAHLEDSSLGTPYQRDTVNDVVQFIYVRS